MIVIDVKSGFVSSPIRESRADGATPTLLRQQLLIHDRCKPILADSIEGIMIRVFRAPASHGGAMTFRMLRSTATGGGVITLRVFGSITSSRLRVTSANVFHSAPLNSDGIG